MEENKQLLAGIVAIGISIFLIVTNVDRIKFLTKLHLKNSIRKLKIMTGILAVLMAVAIILLIARMIWN